MNHDVQELTVEQLLFDIDGILRAAKATAYENADELVGERRDFGFAVVHLIEMARGKVEVALRGQGPGSLGQPRHAFDGQHHLE